MMEALENTVGNGTFSFLTGTYICSFIGVLMYAMFCILP
jgi:hypothetical protein